MLYCALKAISKMYIMLIHKKKELPEKKKKCFLKTLRKTSLNK